MSVGPPPRRARSIAHASAAYTARKSLPSTRKSRQMIGVGPRGKRCAACRKIAMRADRPLVVDDVQHARRAKHRCEIERVMKIALRRRAVADPAADHLPLAAIGKRHRGARPPAAIACPRGSKSTRRCRPANCSAPASAGPWRCRIDCRSAGTSSPTAACREPATVRAAGNSETACRAAHRPLRRRRLQLLRLCWTHKTTDGLAAASRSSARRSDACEASSPGRCEVAARSAAVATVRRRVPSSPSTRIKPVRVLAKFLDAVQANRAAADRPADLPMRRIAARSPGRCGAVGTCKHHRQRILERRRWTVRAGCALPMSCDESSMTRRPWSTVRISID